MSDVLEALTGRAVIAQVLGSLDQAQRSLTPFRHWVLTEILPDAAVDAVRALPYAPPAIGDSAGRREAHNASRQFFGAADQARFPVCAALAQAYQDPKVIRRLERLTGASLAGGFLRIELCLDTQGFWLEPHTDIGAKLYTQLIYLSNEPGSEAWGTDLLTPTGALVARASATLNSGLIFIPGPDTWHGFAPRPINGLRRTLIINYVRDEWRARHELCFPDQPVASA